MLHESSYLDKAWNDITQHPPPPTARRKIKPENTALSLQDHGNWLTGEAEGCILVKFLPQGETINAARYLPTLSKPRRALRDKRPGKKTIILQHESAGS
jgi:hypothetical protein